MIRHMDGNEYRPRAIDDKIGQYLTLFGAVLIEGPEGCGKATSAETFCNSEILLDDPVNGHTARRLAEATMGTVLEKDPPTLITEWQDVPALWDGVRQEADRRTERGQFVLTSSFRPLNLRTLHTGIGRIARLRMRTMSLYETGDSSGEISLERLCDGDLRPTETRKTTLDRLASCIVRGGWPECVDDEPKAPEIIDAYVSRITNDYAGNADGTKHNAGKLELLLHSLARHEGITVTVSGLIRDIEAHNPNGGGKTSIDCNTVPKYIDFLERLHILEDTPSFPTDRDSSMRVIHGAKRHFCDVSLVCTLLKITTADLIADFDVFERLFESLCEHDLKVYADSFGASVYHYRDHYTNGKIDAVIELEDGRWCAFGIRLSAAQIDSACERLKKACGSIMRHSGMTPGVMCVVCGLIDAAYRRDDGIYVVPFTALRP